MSERNIFKISMITNDPEMYQDLRKGMFGIDFEKSYTETQGCAFAFSHYTDGDIRLTAQYWCMFPEPRWHAVRALYFKGSSGLIVLVNTAKSGSTELLNRIIREYISINRYPFPIRIISKNKDAKGKTLGKEFVDSISRWSGFDIPHLEMSDTDEESLPSFTKFMTEVRDWRAVNVVSQALKVHFSLDAITSTSRQIAKICQQLRRIYISTYYTLISDDVLMELIRKNAISEGFEVDSSGENILYNKQRLGTAL